MTESTPTICIVGAGISGLTTAFRLADAGADVRVLEARTSPGGRIGTARRDGYILERGPHTILQRNPATVRLIEDLGLQAHRVEADKRANIRYVVRDGRPVALPMSPGEFLETDLFSTKAKLRLAAEPFIGRPDPQLDESLANFVRRRLGEEFLDYAVAPFVGGIYAGQPRRLSARHAFEKLWRLEHEHGSLAIGGILRALGVGEDSESDHDDDAGPERKLISFDTGASRLIEALHERLGDAVLCDTTVEGLQRRDDGWQVRTAGNNGGHDGPDRNFDAVVWAGTADSLADCRIDDHAPPSADLLHSVDYPPVAVVALGFERAQIDHPLDGFGVLVPEVEPFEILGSLFTSTIFENRAPEGHALLSSFVGGARAPSLVDRDDEKLVDLVTRDLDRLLGLEGSPDLVDIVRWPRAIPQYEVGYGRVLGAIDALEERHSGLYVAGNYRDGISVPELIDASERRADAILDALDRSR